MYMYFLSKHVHVLPIQSEVFYLTKTLVTNIE
jgi:hypothetical protein